MRQRRAPEGMLCHAAFVDGAAVRVGGDTCSPQPGEQIVWYATRGERDRLPEIEALGRRRVALRLLGEAEAMKSQRQYDAKRAEARLWLEQHPDPDHALPNEGWPYLRAEVAAKGLSAHEAATLIDETAAERQDVEDAAREAERIAKRERGRALLAELDSGGE